MSRNLPASDATTPSPEALSLAPRPARWFAWWQVPEPAVGEQFAQPACVLTIGLGAGRAFLAELRLPAGRERRVELGPSRCWADALADQHD